MCRTLSFMTWPEKEKRKWQQRMLGNRKVLFTNSTWTQRKKEVISRWPILPNVDATIMKLLVTWENKIILQRWRKLQHQDENTGQMILLIITLSKALGVKRLFQIVIMQENLKRKSCCVQSIQMCWFTQAQRHTGQ